MNAPSSGNLADRYGVKQRAGFPFGWVIVVTVFVLGVAFIAYLTLGGRDTTPTSSDRSFDIVNAAQTKVTVSVIPDDSKTIRCAVQALNREHSVVGYREFSVPPVEDRDPSERAVVHKAIRTTQLAVNGGIDKCWYLVNGS